MAISFNKKARMSSGPKALNGLIFESKSAIPAGLIVIDFTAGMLHSFNDGKYEVSSVVKTEEKCHQYDWHNYH